MPRWNNWSGRLEGRPKEVRFIRTEEDAAASVIAARSRICEKGWSITSSPFRKTVMSTSLDGSPFPSVIVTSFPVDSSRSTVSRPFFDCEEKRSKDESALALGEIMGV